MYYKQEKRTIQPVDIYTIGSIACKVMEYLKLPLSKEFTGHCLRRSSTSLCGGSITNLKRRGFWKIPSVEDRLF